MEKMVTLIRKQSTPYSIYAPTGYNGMTQEITWMGTKGKVISERKVSMDVFNWLKEYTRAFQNGSLIIKETDDEEVNFIKENIENIDEVEKSVLTKEEVVAILEKGNHNALKSTLKGLVEGKDEILQKEIKRHFIIVAEEHGVDSSAKRRVICEWAGLDIENADLLFDKTIEELHS